MDRRALEGLGVPLPASSVKARAMSRPVAHAGPRRPPPSVPQPRSQCPRAPLTLTL